MEKDKEKFMEADNLGLKGIKFTIGNEEKVLGLKSILILKRHINEWLDWAEHWSHYVNYYKNYNDKTIKKNLDAREKDFEDFKDEYDNVLTYEVGNNFAQFMGIAHEHSQMANNNDAGRVVEKMFKKDYPELSKNLNFDSESSYCYIYTEDRNTAEVFLKWSYEKIIKPKIEEIEKM